MVRALNIATEEWVFVGDLVLERVTFCRKKCAVAHLPILRK